MPRAPHARSPRRRRARPLLPWALAALALSATAPAARASEACPAVAVVDLDRGAARLLLGARPAEPGSSCALAGSAVGHGAGDPAWTSSAGLRRGGAWSPPTLLGTVTAGIPFAHRGTAWFLELPVREDGRVADHYVARPLATEQGLAGARFQRHERRVAHAVARLDDWELLLVEQLAGGDLFAMRISTPGPSMEPQLEETFEVVPAWPLDARLFAADAFGERLLVVARSIDGRVHACDLSSAAVVATLDAAPDARVALLQGAAGLEAAVLEADGTLRRLRHGGETWSELAVAHVAGAPGAIVLASVGDGRSRLAAAGLAGDGAFTWVDGAADPERHATAAAAAGPVVPPPLPATPPPGRSPLLVAGAVVLGFVVLGLAGFGLVARHARRS